MEVTSLINISFGARLQTAQGPSAESAEDSVSDLLAFPAQSVASASLPAAAASVGDADARDIGRRLQAGEALALAQLYDLHAESLFRLLSAMLGRRADAEDALQETFVKLASRTTRRHLLPQLGALGRVRDWRSYLLIAARNEALNVLRRRDRESQMGEDADWEQVPDENVLGAANALCSHDWACLLGRLPLEQREVVVLMVWEQMTFAQIASIVGISPNTAMSRYRYAIERLRSWCQQAEREETDHE